MKITGMVQNSPRLFRRLAETRAEWERFFPPSAAPGHQETQPRGSQAPKNGILQRVPWAKVLDFVVGFGVLAGGFLVILFGLSILAAIVEPK